jgi:hypothetical protein
VVRSRAQIADRGIEPGRLPFEHGASVISRGTASVERPTTPLHQRMREDMALRGLTSDTQRDDIWFAARFATCLGRPPDTRRRHGCYLATRDQGGIAADILAPMARFSNGTEIGVSRLCY